MQFCKWKTYPPPPTCLRKLLPLLRPFLHTSFHFSIEFSIPFYSWLLVSQSWFFNESSSCHETNRGESIEVHNNTTLNKRPSDPMPCHATRHNKYSKEWLTNSTTYLEKVGENKGKVRVKWLNQGLANKQKIANNGPVLNSQ